MKTENSQKLTIGIVTAVLTSIFLGALGLGVRANETNNFQEVRLAKIELFVETQNRLNDKLEKLVDQLRFQRGP